MACPVGIDLGTVNSCMYYFNKDDLTCIKTENGRVLPSYVYFDNETDNTYVGDYGVGKAQKCEENGIYDAKRFIGRNFNEKSVQKIYKNFTYEISADLDGTVKFMISKTNGAKVGKKPEEVSAEVLKSLKTSAMKFLGQETIEAVITVPAYFNTSQRSATMVAAEKAGIKVLKLMSEPTAGALFYFWKKDINNIKALVFDFGGGTLDISIVEVKDKILTVIATHGDSNLGGKNINENLVKYFKQDNFNKRQLRRLDTGVDELKKLLSINESDSVYLDYFMDGTDLELKLTREQFNELNNKIFKRCINLLDQCLKQNGFKKSDMDQVILVGGSTRIPKIQELVSEYFGGKQLTKDLDPDEAVAGGAAIQAAMLKGLMPKTYEIKEIVDVIAISIGYRVLYDKMEFIINKNTRLPVTNTATFSTTHYNQTSVKVALYEGNRKNVQKNKCIGTLKIEDIKPGPVGSSQFILSCNVDINGIINLSVKDLHTGIIKETSFDISSCIGTYSIPDDESAAIEEDEIFVKFTDCKTRIHLMAIKIMEEQDEDVKEDILNNLKTITFERRKELIPLIKRNIEELKTKTIKTQIEKIIGEYEF